MKTYTSAKQIIDEFKSTHKDFEINVGASTLLLSNKGVLFSLVKPKYWRTEDNGTKTIDYSGIGGGIEENESPYNCVLREMKEEIEVSEKDIVWAKNLDAITYTKGQNIRKLQFNNTKEPMPMCIFDLVVPRKYDRPEQKSQSSLLLFVYLMKLKNNTMPSINSDEEIPGLVYVSGTYLNRFLEGVNVDTAISHSNNDFSLHIRESYMKLLPQTFKLSPKFTPRAIRNSGLSYNDFVRFL